MTGISIGEKLQALATIKLQSGIKFADYHDIRMWCDISALGKDMGLLSEKQLENIEVLYQTFFQY